ncbi:NACHT, LRR and PYD domains-containing protein 3-like [Astyanax mexicanus]|uniref:NACHT, LRR and PYD domains-containing protein 3-like n=1 Tax=Astyanax mexicanus TaxID=7994 RepID=UPI0020CB1FC7|nr:NACHT, LRR and PYD domains-containing protein 3-like [Astyanax mexicanus]
MNPKARASWMYSSIARCSGPERENNLLLGELSQGEGQGHVAGTGGGWGGVGKDLGLLLTKDLPEVQVVRGYPGKHDRACWCVTSPGSRERLSIAAIGKGSPRGTSGKASLLAKATSRKLPAALESRKAGFKSVQEMGPRKRVENKTRKWADKHKMALSIEVASSKKTTQERPIKCNDIFKLLPEQKRPIRTVLTKGVAGIGKTVSVQKFILDWAEGEENQNVLFIFPLPFRELNLMKEKKLSLMTLLQHFFPETQDLTPRHYKSYKIMFIFDGLDECRLPLDFQNNENLVNIEEQTSVDVLLTNLIKGNLLPSALLWITSRPAAVSQIPPGCVDQVTEVRGFSDPQKQEYFRKRIRNQDLANKVFTHIKSSRSLYIMCRIPVFCWITATVLESMLSEAEVVLTPKERIYHSNEETIKYIKKKIEENSSPEKSINLFHCLNELNDHSLVQEVQKYLNRGGGHRLQQARLSPTQWSALVFVLVNSEEELEEFNLSKYDASEECLLRLLPVVKISRRAVLASCNLGLKTCENLESVLNLENSPLKELDLSNNDLQDSGVELLSAGLISSHCKLQILRLSGCMITEKGCCSLDSALISNPSHLNELDLTYNHLGESGVKLLSARLEDPHCKLETLRVEHGGMIRIKPGFKKYGCDFTLDPNTAHRYLSLSEENRMVENKEELQSYPDHPERFDGWYQVLSRESVTGRCYWEAEWSGGAAVALSYKTISRKGGGSDCQFGGNINSWRLFCSDNSYSVLHKENRTDLPPPPSGCRKVGVYVDCPSGILSFYNVSTDTHTLSHTLTHIHTFYATFTQPLYAGIRVYFGSSVRLCKIE